MPIVASVLAEDAAQLDGRRHVTEQHTDGLAVPHLVRYMAEAATDASVVMAARVPTLNAQLIAAELATNIANILSGDYGDVTLNEVDVDTMRTALRALYQTATGEQVGRLAGFLLTLTDANLRNLFNMTQPEVVTLRVRLQARVDELQAVLLAAGE